MKIILVRHGESEFNKMNEIDGKAYCGQYNTKLTEQGVKAAADLQSNEYVKQIQRVYASDLDRAVDSARLATKDCNVIVDRNLRERSLGAFEGKSESELTGEYAEYFTGPIYTSFRHDFSLKAPQGENYTEVCDRCNEFLKTINLNEDVVIGVFSHFCTIRCLVHILMGTVKEDTLKLKIRNCEPIVLTGNKLGEFKLEFPEIAELMG